VTALDYLHDPSTAAQRLLLDAARDLGLDFRNDYSGRGMYGRECVGVVGDVRSFAQILLRVAEERIDHELALPDMEREPSAWSGEDSSRVRREWDRVFDALTRATWDSMGRDLIFYWPDLGPLPDEEVDGDEDDPRNDQW
jgi:hypothetical protein